MDVAGLGKQSIDWRKISTINADKIIRENDVDQLQGYLEMVTFADVDGIRDVDPCVATLLKLSQTMTQYTLATQEQLKQSLLDLETENAHLRDENILLKNDTTKNEEYVRKLKIDNRKRRKIIEDLQKRIDLGANAYYSCPHCTKNFINATYLQGHLARKHPDQVSYFGDAIAHAKKIVSDVNTNLEEEKRQARAKNQEIDKRLAAEEEARRNDVSKATREVEEQHKSHKEQMGETIRALEKRLEAQRDQSRAQEDSYATNVQSLRTEVTALKERLENAQYDIRAQKEYAAKSSILEEITPRAPSNHSPPRSRSRTPEHDLSRQTPAAVTLPDAEPHHVPFEHQRPPLGPNPAYAQSPERKRPISAPVNRPPPPSRRDYINQLEQRLDSIGLNLAMAGLSDEEYQHRMNLYREQRNRGWGGQMQLHELKQNMSNELESRCSLRSRHDSSSQLAIPLQDSPVRTKSLSQPNLAVNAPYEAPSTGSILKKPGGNFGPSQISLPSTQFDSRTSNYPSLPPSVPGSSTDMKKKLLEQQNYDQVVLQAVRSDESVPQAAPRGNLKPQVKKEEPQENSWGDSEPESETEAVSSKAEEPTSLTPRMEQVSPNVRQPTPPISEEEDEEDDPSAAWNESSRAVSGPAKSVSYADDFASPKQNAPSSGDDDDDDAGDDGSDDWMDDLDEALAKQGYNGL